MADDEIREGDTVRHRQSGKQGQVTSTDVGTTWQAAGDITPHRWLAVWWDGEPKPAIEDPADVEKAERPR